MVLLVVGRVMLPAPTGLPATSVWWLRVATRSAHARATSRLRPTGHLAAFGTARARAWLRPRPGAPGGRWRRATGLWRGCRDSAARRRGGRRSGGRGRDGGRRSRGRTRARRSAGGRGIGWRSRDGRRRRTAHSGRGTGTLGDDRLGFLRRRRGLLMGRLVRRRLLVRRGLLRRRLLRRRLLLLLVRRWRRERWLRAARARAHGAAVLVEAHARRRRAEVVEAATATASSTPMKASTATTATPEPIPRHICSQGAVEAEAKKTLRERGGHLASHKMADHTSCAPPLSSS